MRVGSATQIPPSPLAPSAAQLGLAVAVAGSTHLVILLGRNGLATLPKSRARAAPLRNRRFAQQRSVGPERWLLERFGGHS